MFYSLFLDEPGAPGKPEATDWDKDHVDLKWTPPISDGGSPITAYVIEKREPETGKWFKAAEVQGADCKATVPHLDENTEYEFRVRAVNAAGPGDASKASEIIITKPRKCECCRYILDWLKIVFLILKIVFGSEIMIQWHRKSTARICATSQLKKVNQFIWM